MPSLGFVAVALAVVIFLAGAIVLSGYEIANTQLHLSHVFCAFRWLIDASACSYLNSCLSSI